MFPILAVAAGGAFGALSRFGIDNLVQRRSNAIFPWATLLINLSGCLAVGFIIVTLVDRHQAPQWLRGALVIGFCGGYTTFSTFAQESLNLIEQGNNKIALASITANVMLGLAAVWAGAHLGRLL